MTEKRSNMKSGKRRRWAIGPFTEGEVRSIEILSAGADARGLAQTLGISIEAANARIWRLFAKTGVANASELKTWAEERALDTPLGPEFTEPDPPLTTGTEADG